MRVGWNLTSTSYEKQISTLAPLVRVWNGILVVNKLASYATGKVQKSLLVDCNNLLHQTTNHQAQTSQNLVYTLAFSYRVDRVNEINY